MRWHPRTESGDRDRGEDGEGEGGEGFLLGGSLTTFGSADKVDDAELATEVEVVLTAGVGTEEEVA